MLRYTLLGAEEFPAARSRSPSPSTSPQAMLKVPSLSPETQPGTSVGSPAAVVEIEASVAVRVSLTTVVGFDEVTRSTVANRGRARSENARSPLFRAAERPPGCAVPRLVAEASSFCSEVVVSGKAASACQGTPRSARQVKSKTRPSDRAPRNASAGERRLRLPEGQTLGCCSMIHLHEQDGRLVGVAGISRRVRIWSTAARSLSAPYSAKTALASYSSAKPHCTLVRAAS